MTVQITELEKDNIDINPLRFGMSKSEIKELERKEKEKKKPPKKWKPEH